jgi:pimeloyl-ACP methyl ester carboxylesterase
MVVTSDSLALQCGAKIIRPSTLDLKKMNVILLLGWLGCEDRFLSKYSKIYEEDGHITIRLIASPVRIMMLSKRRLAEDVIILLNSIFNNEAPDAGLVIHAFSNGGSLIYEELANSMSAPGPGRASLRARLRGIIFDSTPARLTFPTAWRALSAAVPSLLLRVPIMFGMLIFNAAQFLLLDLPFRRPSRPALFWNTLADDPAACPQLFIYSPADAIVPCADVEAMLRARTARGVAAAALRLDGSPHVGHLRTHPAEYAAAVRRLLALPPPPKATAAA